MTNENDKTTKHNDQVSIWDAVLVLLYIVGILSLAFFVFTSGREVANADLQKPKHIRSGDSFKDELLFRYFCSVKSADKGRSIAACGDTKQAMGSRKANRSISSSTGGDIHSAESAYPSAGERVYKLKDSVDDGGYKNDRLEDLQKHARENGLEEWKIKTYLAWLYSENGTLSENHLGDYGHAKGLCQCNNLHRTCAQTYDKQKKQCLDWFMRYTENSTKQSIRMDVRGQHNSLAVGWYEKKIEGLEELFVEKI